MKQTVEEATNDYLQKILEASDFEINFEEDNYDAGARDAVLDVTERAFKAGAEWQAKQSPWISVKERLPEEGEHVLIRLKDGIVRLVCYDTDDDVNVCFWSDNYAYETISGWDVTHWTPTPSFDEILEANKDVLERIKEKGD
jgi:hypothetical protein